MSILAQLSKNPFLSRMLNSSRENLVQFLDDTENRFARQDTNNVYKVLRDLFGDKSRLFIKSVKGTLLGDQAYSTDKVLATISEIQATGGLLHAFVVTAFKNKKAPELKKFFPSGLTGLYKAKRGDYINILDVWLDKITEYGPKFAKTTWAADILDLKTRYAQALASQSGEKSDVQDARETVHAMIEELAGIVWRMSLQVLSNEYANAEDAIKKYFDTAPLEEKSSSDSDGLGRVAGTVTDNSGKPLGQVAVEVLDEGGRLLWKGKTNKEGKWRSANVAIGQVTVKHSKVGFKPLSQTHEILDYEDTVLDAVLES